MCSPTRGKELTSAQLDALDPDTFAIALLVGGDDILTMTGTEIIASHNELREEEGGKPTKRLSVAVRGYLKETSGNSWDAIVVDQTGKICLPRLNIWPKEE